MVGISLGRADPKGAGLAGVDGILSNREWIELNPALKFTDPTLTFLDFSPPGVGESYTSLILSNLLESSSKMLRLDNSF